ncbi:MAG: isoleucyl-tRNA synthetase [Nocardioidaceae bacterium]|jgi:isoleucyl-tRNA synthetase|nr:isoleucyl-tRNA synthetase [Nocardioidaceae bacterium]
MSSQYRAVPAQVDLVEVEHQILQLWRDDATFAASLAQTNGRPSWTFYEGPPTANGVPGVHHVEARVFKDLFPRFKTMRGYHVDRKAGWDCQGLHVEVGVEKELGLSGKKSIEEYGIAKFNARCRASVERHVHDFEVMTERMGYWVDLEHAYKTMDPTYIESVWWSLKRIFDDGRLFEAQRVSPYCPRCETTLSDHELALGYETVTDPSVYVRLPLTSGPLAGKAALLVWTTTPWTLVSNTAVAVNPAVDYVVATNGSETVVVAEPLFDSVLGDGWRVVSSYPGTQMERWTYQRPLDLVDFPTPAHYVVLADYVTTDDGTGLVHQSPAFGPEDLEVARAYGLPVVNPVLGNGRFADDVALVGGQFFKHADADLVRELERRGALFRHLAYEHSYPHCWRCHTPLLYYALPAWYVRTTDVKEALLRENERTSWYPETIKWGRFGDWLRNNVDWSLSRTRFWGTPLPIWRCEAGHLTCVGSLAELGELAGHDLGALDPHRPYVDDVTFACPQSSGDDAGEVCRTEARRVSEVIDAWYDSGSMPFAQWGYPYAEGSRAQFEAAYPAHFICEAIDQTRGWFYSLMAIGTLLFDRSAYENVVCLGHLMAEDGRKMSKHLGNIVEPMPLMEEYGADALRWFMAASGSPLAARRIGPTVLQEIVRKVLLTYWNTVAFHALYARANGWGPADGGPPVAERPVLDRWLVSSRNRLVREVTAALEGFDTQRAGQLLSGFVDELSNWYVRRSRRRFWEGDASALVTLHETLDVLTRLLAPLVPFVSERVWQDLRVASDGSAPPSVHLAQWPSYDENLIDDSLEAATQLARRLVELGRSARAEAKVRTRQPLRRALVSSGARATLSDDLAAEVAAELNIGTLESFTSAGDLVDHLAKGNFRNLGRRFGKRTQVVARAIEAADASRLAAELAADGRTTVEADDVVELTADDVILSERPREGWSVVNEHGETIALDLHLTPELVRAGLAREVVRLVQEARKTSGLQVTDRIRLQWSAGGDLAEAVREHAALIASEVLAVEMSEAVDEAAAAAWARDEDLEFAFAVTRA